MIKVATTSLPAVDRLNADRWNTARLCQKLTLKVCMIKCKKIENDNTMKLEFSKNFNGNVNQIVKIARKFKENIEIIDEIFKQ